MRLGEHDMNMKRAETLAQVLDTPLALAGLFGGGGGTALCACVSGSQND